MQPRRDHWIGSILLVVTLLVVCLRATHSESPHVPTTDPLQALTNQAYSVLISGILAAVCAVAGGLLLGQKTLRYRRTGLGWGILLFLAGAAISCAVASDKRSAMTAALTLAAPMMLCLTLSPLLDSRRRIGLVLMVVVSLGLVNVYQCYEQAGTGNTLMIEQYKNDPMLQLGPLGIEPGSFEHMLYEHRLYGKDVKGFFTTGNSAGSFFLLAVSAMGCLWSLSAGKKSGIVSIIVFSIVLLGLVVGLFLTHSKGAIVAAAIGGAGYLLLRFWGPILFRYRSALVMLAVLAAMALTAGVLYYGFTYDRLPGGNSMLVRWQYWRASIRLIAEQPLAGVGGGNFRHCYPHYKIPAAVETVHDPHNFLLSLWTQFGLIGLGGFLLAVLWPLANLFLIQHNEKADDKKEENIIRPTVLVVGAVLALGMVVLRPFFIEGQATQTQDFRTIVQLYLYGFPALVFLGAFVLLWFGMVKNESTQPIVKKHSVMVLLCGLGAFLLANLIDFAIFEPGIYTTFWVLMACLIALRRNEVSSKEAVLSLHPGIRYAGSGLVLAGLLAVFFWMVAPVVRAGRLEQLANWRRNEAHALLERAALLDRYDPEPVRRNAKLYLWEYEQTGQKEMLERAADWFRQAERRNPASFKDDRQLALVYRKMAEHAGEPGKKELLWKAFKHAKKAAAKYPGSAELHMEMGDLAMQTEIPQWSLKPYLNAVEIEDAFREMFRIMYPGREIQSRLGEEKYQRAKRRIEELTNRY
ncbi:MAG: O-antigen ligase family protein [Sedimentisphaerales bacterium]|nr:O-antigen ligase family protein [Sedimentisphaerales bacterium]